MGFKSNKSPEIDNIGPKILKKVWSGIANPLTYIFNLSFSAGVVFATYFTENSLIYNYNTRGKPIYMLVQFSLSVKKD